MIEDVTTTESVLKIFAKEMGSEAIDKYMPIDCMSPREQLEQEKVCDEDMYHESEDFMGDSFYWTNDERGYHGFHCNRCGRVIQWG